MAHSDTYCGVAHGAGEVADEETLLVTQLPVELQLRLPRNLQQTVQHNESRVCSLSGGADVSPPPPQAHVSKHG